MSEAMISAFIDDELDLDEKIAFVENIHADGAYKREAVALLDQEKRLRVDPVAVVPPAAATRPLRRYSRWWRPLVAGLGAAAALVLLWISIAPHHGEQAPTVSRPYRFLLYRPGIQQAALSGSFTDWRPVGMRQIGTSGYWEVHLDLTGGEHRFAYILDGRERVADPTVLIREKDDFGGENSILHVNL